MLLTRRIHIIVHVQIVTLSLFLLSCGRLYKDHAYDTIFDGSYPINVKDTVLIKSIIDSVYASDKIEWPHDFNDLDTPNYVGFASIRAHVPSLSPNSMIRTFGPCIEEVCVSFDDDMPWYESDEAIRYGWTKEIGIESDLREANYHICYSELMPIISRIDGKFEIAYKRWRFDDNHFIELYYLLSDTNFIPIDGHIIHNDDLSLVLE